MILSLLEVILALWLLVGIIRAVLGILQSLAGFIGFVAMVLWTFFTGVVPIALFRSREKTQIRDRVGKLGKKT